MQRVGAMLKRTQQAAKDGVASAAQQKQVQEASSTMHNVGKFVHDNSMPRYILYGFAAYKSVLIYDKIRQMVAVNNLNASML